MRLYTSVEYNRLLQRGLQSGEISHHCEGNHSIIKAQHPLFKGYIRQIQLRSGLSLKISDCCNQSLESIGLAFQHDLDQPLTLAFQLTGYCQVHTEGINADYYTEKAGESYLFFVPGTHETEAYPAKIKLKSVRICINPEFLRKFLVEQPNFLPGELQCLLAANEAPIFHRRAGIITPPMQLAIDQILHCSYQGITQQLYLESKVLELIALQFAQLAESIHHPRCSGNLQATDIDRIYQAKEILIRHVENPPSLLELARQVGLNDYKLKRGFRQVYNTTVYGYLKTFRMERAKLLLAAQPLSIASVARSVGYSSQSRFCDAFKKHVGMTPRDYKIRQSA